MLHCIFEQYCCKIMLIDYINAVSYKIAVNFSDGQHVCLKRAFGEHELRNQRIFNLLNQTWDWTILSFTRLPYANPAWVMQWETSAGWRPVIVWTKKAVVSQLLVTCKAPQLLMKNKAQTVIGDKFQDFTLDLLIKTGSQSLVIVVFSDTLPYT